MTTRRIPFFDARFDREEIEAVIRPLERGWLTMGEEVQALEEEIRGATGAAHAVAVANGTAALHLASAALGLGPGDEVICPSLTFVASASAPRALGADIRLCASVGSHDLAVDPAAIEASLSDRTRAIVVVHYAGFACDMEAIRAIAEPRGIPIIEDCAHALFTRHRGRMLGLHGRVGCFSFYSNKNATCGEGGALITDDAELAESLRRLRSHGMTVPTLDRKRGRASSYDVIVPGFNYRIDEIRAALLRVQLGRLPKRLERRRQLFQRYAAAFAGTAVQLPFTEGRHADELEETGVHILPVVLPAGTDRTALVEQLKKRGIQTSVHYPAIHTFSAYSDQDTPSLRATGELSNRELSLPFYPDLADEDVDTVAGELLAILEQQAAPASRDDSPLRPNA
jgi:dTDP-4-amino-4,6-dideoxygalactose transaminase